MPKQILVAGPAWVGDMVMTQSLCIALKAQHPQASIDMLAPTWSLPLIARMPQVRRGVALPTTHGEFGWGKRRDVAQALRGVGYQRALVLPRSAKAALVPWLAKIPVRTGYRGELRFGLINDVRPLDKTRLTQTVQRFVALGLPANAPQPPRIDFPSLRVDSDNQARLFDQFKLDSAQRLVALVPGAEYGPAKRWPARHFGVLAQRLGERGIGVMVLGSAKERELGAQIAQFAPETTANLCGRTELVDVVDLLAACSAVISNDSGLMHVAAAVNTPLIALYGSSTPAYTPPLTDAVSILKRDVACAPCFERECPLGHTLCLRQISVSDVLAALNNV